MWISRGARRVHDWEMSPDESYKEYVLRDRDREASVLEPTHAIAAVVGFWIVNLYGLTSYTRWRHCVV